MIILLIVGATALGRYEDGTYALLDADLSRPYAYYQSASTALTALVTELFPV